MSDQDAPSLARSYAVGLPAYVTVSADGKVAVEIDLSDLPLELGHDDEVDYSDEEVDWDAQAVSDALPSLGGPVAVTLFLPIAGN